MIPVPENRQLARMRDTSGYRINRAPWGWTAYRPGESSDKDIRAKTLDELAARLGFTDPPAGRPPVPGRAG